MALMVVPSRASVNRYQVGGVVASMGTRWWYRQSALGEGIDHGTG